MLLVCVDRFHPQHNFIGPRQKKFGSVYCKVSIATRTNRTNTQGRLVAQEPLVAMNED